ncbi:MAG: META domain-containing protein [Caldilineales bacterium]
MDKRTPVTLLLITFSLVLLASAACYPPATPVPPSASSGSPITNIEWQWQSVTNQTTRETTEVPDPQNYTIIFRDDGTLNGMADCNSFTGTWSQEAGFSITIGASTMAACSEASLDTQYLQLLSSVAAGGPDGAGNLALETAGGEQRMLFTNGGAAPASS